MDSRITLLIVAGFVLTFIVGYVLGLRKQINWVETVRLMRWQVAGVVAIVALGFMLLFKSPIADAIGRVKSVQLPKGITVSLATPSPTFGVLVGDDVIKVVSKMSQTEIAEFIRLGANNC